MQKLDFQNRETNFWLCRKFAKNQNYPDAFLMSQAVDQNVLKDKNKELLNRFIEFLKNKRNDQITSQLYQDMFAEFIVGNSFEKTFLEFGATDGLHLSNTYSLEKFSNWSGVLAEPDTQWHNNLKLNRPNTKIIHDCVWKKSNETLDFISSAQGELSTIESFKYSDQDSMPANSKNRNQITKKIQVKTISLDDLINIEFNSTSPSYISIDTEGSEYEILKSFDFDNFKPKVFTIEHNHSNLEKQIDELLEKNNFERIFRKLTAFDAWYVSKDALKTV